MIRTQQHRNHIEQLTRKMFDLAEMISGKREINGNPEPTGEDDQCCFVQQVAKANVYTIPILEKIWFLTKTPPGEYLYISDNPFVRTNQQTFGPYGNLGLMCPGIELYMPLSSNLVLAMYCPSFGVKFLEIHNELKKMIAINHHPHELEDKLTYYTALIKAMQGGPAMIGTTDNITYYNSLQVEWLDNTFMLKKQIFPW
jgi:hypothetical protein